MHPVRSAPQLNVCLSWQEHSTSWEALPKVDFVSNSPKSLFFFFFWKLNCSRVVIKRTNRSLEEEISTYQSDRAARKGKK